MSESIADLHGHPGLKLHLNLPNPNNSENPGMLDIWTYAKNKTAKELYKNFSFRKWIMGDMLNKMANQNSLNSSEDKRFVLNKNIILTIQI